MRRLLSALAVLVVSVVGVGALLTFFESRDESTTGPAPATAPGREDPGATSASLRVGNVELRFSRAADRTALEALAEEVAGPDDPALRRAGQAVLVVRDPGAGRVTARAWRRSLKASSPTDPRLRTFVESLLGRGDRGE